MTHEEGVALVAQARRKYGAALDRAVQVVALERDGVPIVEAHFEGNAIQPLEDLGIDPKSVRPFRVENDPSIEIIPNAGAARATAACSVPAGGLIVPDYSHSHGGTAGWNIELDDRIGCLSNWHVIWPYGAGASQTLEFGTGQDATASTEPAHKRVVQFGATAINVWDLAFAFFDDPVEACAGMLANACHSGPYPTTLANSCSEEQDHHKRGAATEGSCGRVVKFGDCDIIYPQGTARFTRQIFYDFRVADGDSGSIAVRDEDHQVTGLVCGLTYDNLAIANPLYQIGWTFLGLNGDGLPRFRS